MKKFEERLQRLEEISEQMSGSDVQLEDAFALFEEGIKLSDSLEKDVQKLEGKVQILMNGEQLAKAEENQVQPLFDLFSEEES